MQVQLPASASRPGLAQLLVKRTGSALASLAEGKGQTSGVGMGGQTGRGRRCAQHLPKSLRTPRLPREALGSMELALPA